MEWRCEWCGKPHEEDDPPCEECGHGSFERAVVQQPADGPAGNSTTVWVCTECGREHTKHAPPCSRCGNATLERREQTVDDSELVAPGYLDLVTPRYVAGLALVLVFGSVLILGLVGVVDLPGMNTDVPGSGESYQGIALADVESEYVEQLNEQRATADQAELRRTAALDDAAESYNQQIVTGAIQRDEPPPSTDQVREEVGGECGTDLTVTPLVMEVNGTGSSAEQMAASILSARSSVDGDHVQIGVDVHVAEGGVFFTRMTC